MEKKSIGFGKQITFLMLGVSFLVFLCAVIIAAVNIRNSLTQASEQKINEVTEIAYNIIDGYKKSADRGEITQAEAQALALNDFKNLKYQGKNYVWVMKYDYTYLCHPSRPVGFDGSTLKDDQGKQYIKELVDNAIAGKTVFEKNYTPKPGDPTKKKYPKISVAKAYPDWQWVVATGVYVDEIDKMVLNTIINICAITALVVLLIVFAANISFVKQLVAKLNMISSDLKNTSNQVSEASYTLEQASDDLARGSSSQAASIQETSASIEETSSVVQQNNDNTKVAASLAKNTKEYAQESAIATQKMMDTMNRLADSSNEISKIIKAIDEIAFQTNLLSLNAAVEAARAGEAGKGFAVVAEEVRNLAQRSAQAAKDTESIIEENINLSKQGHTMAQDVETSLTKINTEADKVSDLLQEIAVATNEQAQGVKQINQAIVQMEEVLQSNANIANSTSSASQELTNQVNSMNDIVDHLYAIVNGR